MYGELKAKAGKLESDFELTKAIIALTRFPSQVKDLPLDYVLLVLTAIIRYGKVKNINIEIEPTDSIRKRSSFVPNLRLVELLEWVQKGLDSLILSSAMGAGS